jgi:hypothetical protein
LHYAFPSSLLTMSFSHPKILRKSKSSSPVKTIGLAGVESSSNTFLITGDVYHKYRRREKKSLARPLIHIGQDTVYGQSMSISASPSMASVTKHARGVGNIGDDNLQSAYSDEGFSLSFAPSTPPSSPQKAGGKRARQWARWRDVVIPSLIDPYLEYLAASKKQTQGRSGLPCECSTRRKLQVSCVSLDSMCSTSNHLLSTHNEPDRH